MATTIPKGISTMGIKNMKQTQKPNKGGFKMKPTRFLTVVLVLLGLVATLSAAGTPAGTSISNQAQGAYDDANGNEIAGATEGYLLSNTVTTTVSQVAGASLGIDQAENVSSLSSVVYSVLFTNTGNGSDTFGLSTGAGTGQTGTYNYEIYSDLNDDGIINTGTNGTDAIVTSTTALDADSTYGLLIKVTDTTVGGAPEGDILVVTLTALSGFDGGVNDATILTTTVQAATVTATITADNPTTSIPGDVITYTVCITNNGSAIAYDVVFTNLIPINTTYSTSSIREGDNTGWAGGSLLTDAGSDDDGDYNITTASTITVSLGNLAGGGGNVCVYYKVVVDAGVDQGTTITNNPEIDFDNGGGTPYPTVDPSGHTDIDIAESFGVDIASTGTTIFTGDPSDSLFYAFTVENLGNGTDNFDLTDASTYVVWIYYADDGDGSLSTAELDVAITNTGDLTENQVGNFVAVGVIPAGTADTATDATTFTATSVGDGTETDTDTAAATCTAPVLTLTKSVTNAGTVYGTGDANSAVPGTVLKYTITIANGGSGVASTVVISDAIPTNTTYVAESMIIDADATITDATGDDEGYLSGSITTGSIVFEFTTMDASGGADDEHILSFEVTIN